MSFPKYSRDLKKGQAWCADICYHARDYKEETIAAEDVKFTIYEAIEINLRTRVLHLEPGTIGFNSFTPAEELKEILGRFMNVRMKGGAKQEFEQKRQGVNEDALEYYDTKLQLYLHVYDEGERNIQEFKRLTWNGLRNLEMMKICWNELSKRTVDWAEIRLNIEDQLTVQRNWNLHPRNLNPDTYRSGEKSHLCNTGQVRMEVNAVTVPVMSAPVMSRETALSRPKYR